MSRCVLMHHLQDLSELPQDVTHWMPSVATIVGIVSGIIVVLVVEKLDTKFHIDDPVGAVGVHLANGIWGTLAVGLLSTSKASAGVDGPIYALCQRN